MTSSFNERISKERLSNLPTKPGVYLMKDTSGCVLYVGKAKNLRARVKSYFADGDSRYNVQFLLKAVALIDTVITEDERQAIILESDLIKKYKPRYNIRLKDDKAHLLVRIDTKQEWPRLELTRNVKNDGARYIGPFAFAYELRAMLETIRKTLPLRTCSDKVLYNRVRPCLEYQIKRCSAPCCNEVDQSEYSRCIDDAISILEGRSRSVIEHLEADMNRASAELRYEDAAEKRDRLEILRTIKKEKTPIPFMSGTKDCFGLFRQDSNVEFSVLMIRQGRLLEAKTFGFPEVELPDEELLSSFLSQYYAGDREIPEEILLPIPLEDLSTREQMYTQKLGARVHITIPKRGSKARILALAEQNASENFGVRYGTTSNSETLLSRLQSSLSLEEVPRTIECVDISHFQGGATVGSVVLFKDAQALKSGYRRFSLSIEGKPDDFASIREVVLRHLSDCAEKNSLSDLMIIDGGMGQLSEALEARKELGLSSPQMIGLAKRRRVGMDYHSGLEGEYKPERVYIEGASIPVVLNPSSKVLHLLERIRDEAHRFAITSHRQARSKKVFSSQLELIPGIGPKRRKDLLREFGSVEAISRTSPEELVSRCGIPVKLAAKIVSVLSNRVRGNNKV